MPAKPTLVVIDFEKHTIGGHFGHYLKVFCTEFARRFEHVACYSPSPEKSLRSFTEAGDPVPPNVSLFPLPKMRRKAILFGRRKNCTLAKVLADHASRLPGQPKACFIMWGYDLLAGRIGNSPATAPWGTFGSFSWSERGYANHEDRSLKQLCVQREDCAVILTPDQFIVGPNLPKALWMPCPADLSLPERSPSEIDRLRHLASGRPIIGSIGILTGDRCVNELLRLTAAYPNLFFLLAGRLFKDTVNPDLAPMLDERKPENLMLIPEYLPHLKHNALISACEAVFVDGLPYPIPSEVACKALHFGKFLITRESNSWTYDTIRKWDVGLAYRASDMDFIEAWKRWKANGGSDRAQQAAREFMSAESFKQCFDQVSATLMKAAA